jgi:uncharacterized membrane protein
MKIVKNINWRDGKLISGLISLGIVLIQQLMVAFGFTYPVDWQNVIGIVNTVLTILGMLGVISDTTIVNNPKGDNNVESKK